MTTYDEAFGMENGYAPTAHRVILVDFDGVLYPWEPIMSEPDPVPGAVEAMRRLKAAGYYLVIFTSRLSKRWLAESGYSESNQRDHIERLLKRDGIPYDELSAEKYPAEAYIDDRAFRFRDNWLELTDYILVSRGAP